MLGEVRVRSDEGRSDRASREATARMPQPCPTAAGAVVEPTSKRKGKCNISNADGLPSGHD
eukprot:3535251-Prorocentrum_lima.AAC.1